MTRNIGLRLTRGIESWVVALEGFWEYTQF